jgi:hypothetical protein
MIKLRGQPRSPAIAATREAKAMVNFSLAEEKKEHSRPIWCQRCRLITDAQEIHGFSIPKCRCASVHLCSHICPCSSFRKPSPTWPLVLSLQLNPCTCASRGARLFAFHSLLLSRHGEFPQPTRSDFLYESGTPFSSVVHALPTSQSVVNRLQRTLLHGIVVACATSRGDPCPARRSCSSAPIRKSVCAA